jgi:hypothetical protein
MRITDMTALSGFARSTAESASDFATLVHNLVLDIRDSYRPGVHCMRGPGPKWRAKSIRRVVVATPLTVQAERRQDKTRAASREMTSSNQFNAFAAARGEGLHPKLRDLLQRAAASRFSEISIRHDGMIQAGPNPASEMAASRGNVTSFPHEKRSAAIAHELEIQKPRKLAPQSAFASLGAFRTPMSAQSEI